MAPWCFRRRVAKTRMAGFPKLWARIAKLGRLPADVTPHTLRHSFASLAGDLGYSEPTIAALVGHKARSDYVAAMFTRPMPCCSLPTMLVADRTAELMGERKAAAVVVELRQGAR